jgi:hypothetical protein
MAKSAELVRYSGTVTITVQFQPAETVYFGMVEEADDHAFPWAGNLSPAQAGLSKQDPASVPAMERAAAVMLGEAFTLDPRMAEYAESGSRAGSWVLRDDPKTFGTYEKKPSTRKKTKPKAARAAPRKLRRRTARAR